MTKVLIVGGGFMYERMYEHAGFEMAKSIEEADLIQFTGGADVDPVLYREQRHPATHASPQRDVEEQWLYERAIRLNKPLVGICRGGQFLNVMNGGKMWQDVNNHAIAGTHSVHCEYTDSNLQVSSTHHQMMNPHESGIVLCRAALSTRKENYPMDSGHSVPNRIVPDHTKVAGGDDVEVVFYPETNSLCYQPHPEIMGEDSDCRKHFFKLVKELLLCKSQ